MRVKPCSLNRKNSGFCKNQEKDVWHALLSFQGTGSPRLDPADDAVPPAFTGLDFRQKTESTVYVSSPRPVNNLERIPTRKTGHKLQRRRGIDKEPRPLRGMRNIGAEIR